ncbi:ferredoxin--NADP reductase [Vibrio sp. CAU 1672]|uniref:ferredoxin--NADP reductase n=1 Tax=Vibrio sp. CAU 1672 TaxID=3032594 RepID=UPI0023DA0C2D|nr:ferredoxin--NADP reductase [Vibrio sp. CAU 1672]MDF2153004.1 ferredoxin--NADP reductase [Vibrio sp. CAU 1672]
MAQLKGFHLATVDKRIDWTQELFSLRVSGAPLRFKAGQFTKLALLDDEGHAISRAYSVVNAPSQEFDWLEFLIVASPNGRLTPRLQKLVSGDCVYVGESAHGELTHDTIPKQANTLWLLATGTGVGPFLSLLDDINLLPHSDHIVLVHGVRKQKDLVYQYLIKHLQQRYQGRLTYLPVISREQVSGKLYGRIPQLLTSGELVNAANVAISQQHSFVMMCGNPEMIKETSAVLQEQGLDKYRLRSGGNFIYERYW